MPIKEVKVTNNEDNNEELNLLEKQIKDIEEWQKNANNPGYFVGSGKVPIPLRNIFKSYKVMIIVGCLISLPSIFSIIKNFSFENVISNIMPLIISCILIIGGLIRMLNRDIKIKER